MIRMEDVNYIYTPGGPFETAALEDINITIEKGLFYGLIGHTGSGKSTLVQLMAGLIKPTSGKILVDGYEISNKKAKVSDIKGKVGLVFQYPEHQLFEETVLADVSFGPGNLGLPENEVLERAKSALSVVGIGEDLYNLSPFELSGGQKRRVAIAGVLAMEPELLILDEPTAGLDPAGRDDILKEIKELHSRKKNTVILVSHNMEDIAKTADKLIVMNNSRIAMSGTLEEIFSKSRELFDMGLSIPEISKVILNLIENGIDIRPDIYTVEEAGREILKVLGGVSHA
jgi:energy-coupling factor transport system ATP-binding protein